MSPGCDLEQSGMSHFSSRTPKNLILWEQLHFSSSVYVLADIRMIFMEAKKKALLEIPPPSSAVLATSTGKVKAVLGRKKRSKYMLF